MSSEREESPRRRLPAVLLVCLLLASLAGAAWVHRARSAAEAGAAPVAAEAPPAGAPAAGGAPTAPPPSSPPPAAMMAPGAPLVVLGERVVDSRDGRVVMVVADAGTEAYLSLPTGRHFSWGWGIRPVQHLDITTLRVLDAAEVTELTPRQIQAEDGSTILDLGDSEVRLDPGEVPAGVQVAINHRYFPYASCVRLFGARGSPAFDLHLVRGSRLVPCAVSGLTYEVAPFGQGLVVGEWGDLVGIGTGGEALWRRPVAEVNPVATQNSRGIADLVTLSATTVAVLGCKGGSVADFGLTVTCLDVTTGETLWQTHCAPSPADGYLQEAYGRCFGTELVIVSQAGARDADYVEVLDVATGKSLRRFDW